MAVTLATIVLALGISLVTCVSAFLVWWFYDQRRVWVTWIREDDQTDTFKVSHDGGESLRVPHYDAEVPLEPEKILYKRGWRSGKHVIVDGAKGVQVLPRSEIEQRVGYDLATLMDTAWATKWSEDFPEGDNVADVLADFLFGWGGVVILVGMFTSFVIWLFRMGG